MSETLNLDLGHLGDEHTEMMPGDPAEGNPVVTGQGIPSAGSELGPFRDAIQMEANDPVTAAKRLEAQQERSKPKTTPVNPQSTSLENIITAAAIIIPTAIIGGGFAVAASHQEPHLPADMQEQSSPAPQNKDQQVFQDGIDTNKVSITVPTDN